MHRFFLLILLLISSCGPRSFEDFQKEGETICQSLVRELERIETREDLLSAESRLKQLFDKLVEVMIEAQQYQQASPLSETPNISNAYDELLLEEMMRIYRIEGGRETIERAQREALIRLHSKMVTIQREFSDQKTRLLH